MAEIKDVYEPLERYYAKHPGATLDLTATPAAQSPILLAQLLTSPNVSKLMDEVSKSASGKNTAKLQDAIIERYMAKGSTFLKDLDRDLGANPAAAATLAKQIQADPNKVALNVAKYTAGNLAAVVAAGEPAVAAVKPSVVSAAAPATPRAEPVRTARAAPEAAIPAAAAPRAEPIAAAVKPATSTFTPEMEAQIQRNTFIALAGKPDAEISVALSSPALVKGIAAGIADQATKMGVGAEYTKSFKDRMARDPQLVDAFQKNLQQNPEFVRQMAKTMRDGGEMPASMKEIAKKTMQDVMEQPEKLADDGFVKRMSQGLSMKDGGGMGGMMGGLSSMFKGMGDMGGMFSGLASFFQGIMDKIQSFIKEVSGGEWLSRRNSGRDFFQAFSDTIDQTPNRLASEANAKKSMVIHPSIRDGKVEYAHAEPIRDEKGVIRMGADGKELTGIKPNTFEVTTISGSKIQVLPATGVPAVRDAQGNYHMNVVTGMDDKRRPSEVQQVVLSVDQFRAYNANIKQYGDPSMPPQYTMADNNAANIVRVGANVTTVDANGAIGKTINTAEVAAANPVRAQPASTARPLNEPAVNDPEYQLRKG